MGDRAHYEDLAIDPAEATDHELHVRNCVKRHTAIVKLIGLFHSRLMKSEIIAWVYRGILVPAILWIVWQMWQLPDRLHQLARGLQ